MRKKKTPSISFTPETLEMVDAYADQRKISRSAAVSELALYVLDREGSETHPKRVEEAVAALQASATPKPA